MISSLPAYCPQCGTAIPQSFPNTYDVTCVHCGMPLRHVEVVAAPPPPALPLEFTGLERPKPARPANPLFRRFGILWFAFSLAFTIFCFDFSDQVQGLYELLQSEGEIVVGRITELKIEDSGVSKAYTVRYLFRPWTSGSWVDKGQYIEEEVYHTLRVGQSVDVIYSRSKYWPAQLKATFSPPNLLPLLLLVVLSLIFDGIGIVILILSFNGLWNDLRLRSNGQGILATVFDRWQDSDSRGTPTYAIAYAFKVSLPDGTLKLITRAELNEAAYDTTRIGSRVRVRYVPDTPDINRLV